LVALPTDMLDDSRFGPILEVPLVGRVFIVFVRREKMLSADQSPIFSSLSSDPDTLELVEEFVDGLRDRVRSLEVAYVTNDIEELIRLAHQLKGSSGGYGFDVIGESASVLEQSSRAAGSVTDVARELERFIAMCRRATAEPVGQV